MLKILELMDILKKNQLRQLPVYDFENSQTLYGDLYDALQERPRGTEDALALTLGYEGKGDANYRKVKHRFKNHLRNTLLLIDFDKDEIGVYGKKLMRLQKLLCIIEIVFSFSKYSIGKDFLKEAFTLANELDMPLFKIQIGCRQFQLREKFSLVTNFDELNEQLSNEIKLREIYKKAVLKKAIQSDDLALLETIPTDSLALHGQYYYHHLLSDHFLSINNYEKTLVLCNQGISALTSRKFFPLSYNIILNNYKLIASIQLKDFESGDEALNQIENQKKISPFNRFKTIEYRVILSFHTQKYQEAYDAFSAYKMDRSIKESKDKLFQHLFEYNELIKAYLLFLKQANKIVTVKRDSKLGPTRIYRFLNSVELLRKEKKSFNIQIQILVIAFLIQKRQFDEAETKIESLLRYTNKFLKGNDYYRIKLFSKLLNEMVKASFTKRYISKKTDAILEKLKNHSLKGSSPVVLTEYFPLEDLWEILLVAIEKK